MVAYIVRCRARAGDTAPLPLGRPRRHALPDAATLPIRTRDRRIPLHPLLHRGALAGLAVAVLAAAVGLGLLVAGALYGWR